MDKELQFLIYNTPEENVSVNAVIKDERKIQCNKCLWIASSYKFRLYDKVSLSCIESRST